MSEFKEFTWEYANRLQRYFEPVKGATEYFIPIRKTLDSAGYDFVTPYEIGLYPGEVKIVKTNIKARMPHGEYLQVSLRSSIGLKGLILPNAPGIIDADYYGNESNDGNIGIIIMNCSNTYIQIGAGERIAQGVFLKYQTTGDEPSEVRKGGFGSSGK